MRWLIALMLLGLLSPATFGQDESRRAQLSAANADALETLRRDVLATRIGREMTIAELLDRTGARAELDATLQGAEQIGGGRWLDEQTVQVRLEVSGADIAKTIQKIAERNSKTLPLSLPALREKLKKDFSHRTFSAVGASTSGAAADRLKPDASQVAWRGVNEKDRKAAVESARRNAVDRVMDSLAPIQCDDQHHLSDAMAAPGVGEPLRNWLAARPITSIEFRDDLEVRISLAASAQDVWPQLKAGLEKQTTVAMPRAADAWAGLQRQVESRMVPPSGVALAKAAQPAAAVQGVALPAQPPQWAASSFNTEGISKPVGASPLKTARAAEAIALQRLRGELNALPLDATLTLGEAARKDAHIEAALARGVSRAQISKVTYDSPDRGSVTVRMALDLGDVWREIAGR